MKDLTRRKTIKNLALSVGAMVSLPTWAQGWSASQLDGPSVFSNVEEQLLAQVIDTLIPAGDAIGALSLGVDKFLLRLLSDCYVETVQISVKHQLHDMAQMAQSIYGTPFNSCEQPQRLAILERVACSTNPETKDTFDLIKAETIRGFRTSKQVMTEYLDYQVMPGHYLGCITVNS